MWTIHCSLICGVMVGFELIDPAEAEGIAGIAIDLGIVRIMLLKDTEQ